MRQPYLRLRSHADCHKGKSWLLRVYYCLRGADRYGKNMRSTGHGEDRIKEALLNS